MRQEEDKKDVTVDEKAVLDLESQLPPRDQVRGAQGRAEEGCQKDCQEGCEEARQEEGYQEDHDEPIRDEEACCESRWEEGRRPANTFWPIITFVVLITGSAAYFAWPRSSDNQRIFGS